MHAMLAVYPYLFAFAFTAASLIAVHQQIVYVCTFIHAFCPPWEALNDFPRAQKYYKSFVYIIGYGAGNVRSTVYAAISTQNGTKTSDAANGNGNGINH